MVKLNRRLSGTSLIETLVAMTIIVTAMLLSFMAVIYITKSFNTGLRTHAYLVVNKHVEEMAFSLAEPEFIDYSSFSIRIMREKFKNNPNLMTLTVSAITNDSIILYEVKEVVELESITNSRKDWSK